MTWGELKKQMKDDKIPDDAEVKIAVDYRGGPAKRVKAMLDNKGKKIVSVTIED